MDFEKVIEDYSGLITKLCYYFSANKEEFKDLRQDVLINIWRGWGKFRNDSRLSTWIYRICFNTCVSYQRKNKRKIIPISIEEIADLAETENFEIEKYNEMHSLINRLNLSERSIILLWLDDKTYEEISEITGIPRNTIAVKLKRIKEKLVKMSNKY